MQDRGQDPTLCTILMHLEDLTIFWFYHLRSVRLCLNSGDITHQSPSAYRAWSLLARTGMLEPLVLAQLAHVAHSVHGAGDEFGLCRDVETTCGDRITQVLHLTDTPSVRSDTVKQIAELTGSP